MVTNWSEEKTKREKKHRETTKANLQEIDVNDMPKKHMKTWRVEERVGEQCSLHHWFGSGPSLYRITKA